MGRRPLVVFGRSAGHRGHLRRRARAVGRLLHNNLLHLLLYLLYLLLDLLNLLLDLLNLLYLLNRRLWVMLRMRGGRERGGEGGGEGGLRGGSGGRHQLEFLTKLTKFLHFVLSARLGRVLVARRARVRLRARRRVVMMVLLWEALSGMLRGRPGFSVHFTAARASVIWTILVVVRREGRHVVAAGLRRVALPDRKSVV